MVQFNALTATPVSLKQEDLVAVYDASYGDLVQVAVRFLLARIYGGIYADNVTVNLGAVSTVWTKITAFDAETTNSYGCTPSHSNDQITIDAEGIVLIQYSVTAYNDAGARQIGCRIANNGVAVDQSYAHEVTTAASSKSNMSGHAMIPVAANDVITLETTHSHGASGGNLYISDCSLNITYVGPKA